MATEKETITEPTGKAFGAVSRNTTIASLVAPLVAVGVVFAAHAVGIMNSSEAFTVISTLIAAAGLTGGAVAVTGKNTQTDQVRTRSETTVIQPPAPDPELRDAVLTISEEAKRLRGESSAEVAPDQLVLTEPVTDPQDPIAGMQEYLQRDA